MIIDAATMLQNLSMAVPELMRLVTAIAYVGGMYFIVHGVVSFRNVPPMGNTNPPMTVKKCLVFIFAGTALLYLPSAVQVGTSTFWGNVSPYAYISHDNGDQWSELIKSAYAIVQVVGVIALIRGIMLFTTTPHQQEHHPFARAMTHCVGGILCINLEIFIMTVVKTLGIGV